MIVAVNAFFTDTSTSYNVNFDVEYRALDLECHLDIAQSHFEEHPPPPRGSISSGIRDAPDPVND
jgi:hypothetical protein